MDIKTEEQKEKKHTLRKIIITLIISLVLSGIVRMFLIADHNMREQEERLNHVPVPTLNAPMIER